MNKLLPIVLLLAGCATKPTAKNCGPELTDTQIQSALQAYIVNMNWQDPESVQVRNIRVQPCSSHSRGLLEGGPYVGREIDFEVTTKSGHGGYEQKSLVLTADGNIHYTLDE